MILSVPIQGGFAYFESPPPAPRQIEPRQTLIPLEIAAPLLPLPAIPVGKGTLATGQIAFAQNAHQANLLQKIEAAPFPTDHQQEEVGILPSLAKALLFSAVSEVIL